LISWNPFFISNQNQNIKNHFRGDDGDNEAEAYLRPQKIPEPAAESGRQNKKEKGDVESWIEFHEKPGDRKYQSPLPPAPEEKARGDGQAELKIAEANQQ